MSSTIFIQSLKDSIVKSARKKDRDVNLITGEHIQQCFAEKGNDDLDFIKDIVYEYTACPFEKEKDDDDERNISKKRNAVVPNYSKIYKQKVTTGRVADDKQGHQTKIKKNRKDAISTSSQSVAKKGKLTNDRDLEQYLDSTDLERYNETNLIRGKLKSDEIIEDDEDYD